MSYTSDDLASVTRAIANGAQSAMINGEMVTFRTLAELRSIRAEIEAALSGSAAALRFEVRTPSTSRGL